MSEWRWRKRRWRFCRKSSETGERTRSSSECVRRRSDVVEQAAVEEGLDGVGGSGVVLVFPSLNEGDESGRVQVRDVLLPGTCVGHAARLQPGLQQARRRGGSVLRLALQQQADKVLGGGAHSLEVVVREAEVQTADVETRLLEAFVQEGRGAAQYDVGHDP